VERDTMTSRPDITIRHGHGAVVVGGDRAHELVDAAGCVHVPTYAGWQVALVDLPRLRAIAEARGWSLIEHEPTRPT
jgi:hypothetical protein